MMAVPASGSPTALLAGTDFQVEDSAAGMITLLSSAAAAAKSITVGYTAAALTTSRVTGGTSSNIRGAFKWIADPTSGPAMNLHVWSTEVTPNGAMDLISDDFGSMTLAAEVLDDSANHPTAPLYEVNYPNG